MHNFDTTHAYYMHARQAAGRRAVHRIEREYALSCALLFTLGVFFALYATSLPVPQWGMVLSGLVVATGSLGFAYAMRGVKGRALARYAQARSAYIDALTAQGERA